MSAKQIECGVSTESLASWKEFVSLIQESHTNCPAYIYRGQAEASWKIESALDRLEKRFPITNNFWGRNPKAFNCPPVARDIHLEAFKESVRGKRGPSPNELPEDEWWALAQHHGLATPLLDWAYSPFVALFFAFEHKGYVDSQNGSFRVPEKRAVCVVPFHFFDSKHAANLPAPKVFSPRREITQRLSSQSGILMRMPQSTDLESIVRERHVEDTSSTNPHARSILTKITMPDAGRIDCLKFLNKMNINRASLFADLDGAAQYINSLWELDFDTALGSLPDGTE